LVCRLRLGEPFFPGIALGAEAVVSFTRGVYLSRGFGSRGGRNRHFLLPGRRCIARAEDLRI
jgi:hypothetical protein